MMCNQMNLQPLTNLFALVPQQIFQSHQIKLDIDLDSYQFIIYLKQKDFSISSHTQIRNSTVVI